jgi:autotransporter-associated beta strand protein
VEAEDVAESKSAPSRCALRAACLATVALLATPAAALTINSGSAAGNNRFASGFPNAPVANTSPSFIGAGYDWSGVGWADYDPSRGFALLGPDQVLVANHFSPGLAETLSFSPSTGGTISVTIASLQGTHVGLTNDLAVGTLTTPIPASANVCYYPILFQGYSPSAYVGDTVLMYGNGPQRSPWIGSSTIAAAGQLLTDEAPPYGPDYSQYVYYAYNTSTPNQAIVQGGDSGSPTFIVYGGQLYLAGAHYLQFPQGSLDTFTSLSLPTLDRDMGQNGYLPYVFTPTSAQWTGSGGGTGSWASGANWSTGSVPVDVMTSGSVTTCASVLFNGATTSQYTVSLDGSQTVTSITFANSSGSNAFTITGTDLLTIGEAGITNQAAQAQNINCPIALRTSQRWAVGAGGLNVTGPVNLGSGAAGNLLLVEGAGPTLLSGPISGSTGSLAIYGGGIVTLGNANSYGGQTFVNGGTLLLGAVGALPSSSNVTVGGGTLDLGGFSTAAGTVTLQSGLISDGSLFAAAYVAQSGSASANLGGSGSLTTSTSGTVTLSGSNSYGGGTFINAGNLVFTSTAAVPAGTGNISVKSGGALNVTGAYGTVSGWLASNNISTASSGALALTATASSEAISMSGYAGLSLGSAGATIYTGTLTPAGSTYRLGGGGGALTLPNDNSLTGANALVVGGGGPGTVVLAGSNGYSGGTTLAGGELDINNAAALGSGALTISSSGGALGNSSTAALTLSTNNAQNWNGNFTFVGSNDLNLGTGAVTLGGNCAVTVSSNTLTVGGPISGSGFSLATSGSGLLTLAGTNTYSGSTTISAGAVQFDSPASIGGSGRSVIPAANTVVAAGYPIDNGFLQRLPTGVSTAFTVALAVSSSNNLDFSSTAGASLAAASLGALGNATYTGTLTPYGATYLLGGGGGALTLGANTLTGSNTLLVGSTGNGTVIFGGTNNYTGSINVLAGTLALGVSGAIPSASNVTISGGTLDLGGYSTSAGTVTLQSGLISDGTLSATAYVAQSGTISASLVGSVSLTTTGSGSVTLSGSNSYGGGTFINAGNLVFTSTAAVPGGTGNISVNNGGALNVAGAYSTAAGWLASNNISTASSGALALTATASSEAISMSGYAGLSLGSAGATIYTGTLMPAGSTYRLGGGGGTLTLPNDNSLTGANALVVGGGGPGTVVLAGSNGYSGGTTLLGGELDINNAAALGSGALTISGGALGNSSTAALTLSTNNAQNWNGNFTFAGSNDLNLGTGAVTLGGNCAVTVSSNTLTVGGPIGGNGDTLTKAGEGTLQLAGSVQCPGVTVNGGTLRLGANNELVANPQVTTAYDGALDTAGYNQTISGLTMSGGTVDSGAGAITLTGSVTYLASNWTATVNGNLILAAATATTFNVASGSAMDLDVNASISGGTGGGIIKTGDGLLTLSGTNTYSGSTVISAGIVEFDSPASIGGSGRSVIPAANTMVFVGYPIDNGFLQRLPTGVSTPFTIALTVSSSNNLDFSSTAGASLSAVSLGAYGAATYTGTLTPNGATYHLGGGWGTLTLPANNALTGANALLVGSTGVGMVVLAGTNDYSGDTTISSGTLQLGVANALPSGPGKGNVIANGVLDLNGQSATINGLSGSGNVDNSGTTAATLTVGANDASSTFAGSITNSGTGTVAAATLSLVKTGTGVLTLAGTDTYTGGTTVDGGTLDIADPAAMPTTGILNISRPGSVNLLGLLSEIPDAALPPSSADTDTDLDGATGAAPDADDPGAPSDDGAALLPEESSFSTQAVPEPSGMALLAVVGLVAWSWRVYRRRADRI